LDWIRMCSCSLPFLPQSMNDFVIKFTMF
jgi:hypothetical protein